MSLPRLDPTITVEQLEECGQRFLEAGYAYWEMMNKIKKLGGAVAWITNGDGHMVIFTRGEYSDTLLRNIDRLGPSFQFGAGDLKDYH
jgi:hypothetical protein